MDQAMAEMKRFFAIWDVAKTLRLVATIELCNHISGSQNNRDGCERTGANDVPTVPGHQLSLVEQRAQA